MKMYELIPTNGRKSFYGKARVIEKDNGEKVLQSYNTEGFGAHLPRQENL